MSWVGLFSCFPEVFCGAVIFGFNMASMKKGSRGIAFEFVGMYCSVLYMRLLVMINLIFA